MVAATVCEGNLTKKYTFQYDANGNLTKECYRNCAEVTYQYDTENRLAAVYNKNKLLVATSYDGDGNRVFQLNYNPEAECGYGMNVSGEIFMPEHSQNEDESLTAEGQLFSYICSETGRTYELTEYVNDINREYTEVLTAYNINTNFDTESYSYAGTQRVSNNSIWNEARNVDHNEMSYYLYDGRGSVTAKTWYNGMVTNAYQYDPYGQVTLGSTEHTDFYGYNAESYNPNTGLEYLRARYYHAEQGRFFQEDTYLGNITDPLTLNRYAYVKNSPMNYRDPSGQMPVALLQALSMLYDNGLLNTEEISVASIIFNGLGFFTAMHEIAQLNTARYLYDTGHISELERKVQDASKKTWWGGCKSYEIDVVADGTKIWEVKSIGQSVGDAVKQVSNYANLGDYELGYNINIHKITIFGRYYMNIDSDILHPEILKYSFKKEPQNPQEQVEEVLVADMKSAYYKVYAAAVTPFILIMGATAIEDVASLGAGIADDVVSLVAALEASLAAVAVFAPAL